MSPDLPPALRLAADALLQGVARKGVVERAAAISAQYRAGRSSAGVVGSEADASAYVLTRLPATYAAGVHVLAEAADMAPDFAPSSLLDAGAGPGGAGWAAAETWPGLASATLLDSNRAFLDMAQRLAADGPTVLRDATRMRGDLTAPEAWPAADLVIASYALAEIPEPKQAATVAALWTATQGMLVLIEPGTPAGWTRILVARDRLIAEGAAILAPCAHQAPCPLNPPDWCHFIQRLPRSRDHRLAKGGEVPFEDEKFIYLVAARPHISARPHAARILAPARTGKPGIEFKLCTPQGTAERRFVGRRDKTAHAVARRLDWGDTLPI